MAQDFVQDAIAKSKQAAADYAENFEPPVFSAPALQSENFNEFSQIGSQPLVSAEAEQDMETPDPSRENKDLATVLLDNSVLDNLSGGISQQWNKSMNRTENNELYHMVRDRVLAGGESFTEEELATAQDIAYEVPFSSGLGWLNGLPDATAIVGDYVVQAKEGGLAGAAAFGTSAFLAKRFGMKVDPLKFMSVGGSVGIGYSEYNNQVAEQFFSLSQAKDVKGNRIPPEVAASAASVVAGLNTVVEIVGLQAVARVFPGMKNLSLMKSDTVGKILANNPSAQQLVRRLGANDLSGNILKATLGTFGAAAAEGGTEVLQELVSILAEGVLLPEALDRDVTSDLTQAALSPVAGMLTLAGSANAVGVGVKAMRRKKDKATNKDSIDRFTDGVVVELKKYTPEQVADRIQVSNAAPVLDQVAINQQAARKLFQQDDDTPDEKLRQAYPELMEAIDAADGDPTRSVDLSDPLVAAQLVKAADEQGKLDELKSNMTYGDAMPDNYFDPIVEEGEPTDKPPKEPMDLDEEPGSARQNFLSDLVTTQGAEYAQATVKLMDSFFEELSEKSGISVNDLWEQNAIKVQKEQSTPKQGLTMLRAAIQQLRRGGEVTDKQILGPSVVDFIKSKGGIKDADLQSTFGNSLGAAPSMTMDQMAEAIFEEGFPVLEEDSTNTSVVRWTSDMVFAAVEAELQMGQELRKGDVFNEDLQARRDTMDALARRFDELDVDFTDDNFDKVYNDFINAELKDAAIKGFESIWVSKEDLKNRRLNQSEDSDGNVRGWTTFDDKELDGFIVTLTGKANRTTVIHEMAHVMLAILNDHAKDNELIAEDMEAISKWAGFTPGQRIEESAHEKFAEAFEKYLMTGKSPVAKLINVFEKFKTWMMRIYTTKAMRSKLELAPEASEFFDRMLGAQTAADASAYDLSWGSIEQVEALMDLLGENPGAISAQARAEAESAIRAEVMKGLRKQSAKDRVAYRKSLTQEITEQVEADMLKDPVLGLKAYFTDGITGIKKEFGDNPKFNRLSVQAYFSSAVGVASLQKLMTTKADPDFAGYSLDQVAEVYGFESADAMVYALTTAPSKADLVKERVDARMAEDLSDVDIEADADIIMAEKAQDVLLYAYTRTYNKKSGNSAISIQATKQSIRDSVRDMRLVDVDVNKAFVNYQNQIRKFTDAVREKDVDAALRATRDSFEALQAYKEMRKVVKLKTTAPKRLRRYNKKSMREMLRKAGRNLPEGQQSLYYDALYGLLQNFDAGIVSKDSIKNSQAAQVLRRLMSEDGRDIAAVAQMEGFSANLMELTAEQIDTLFNAADGIIKLAREQYASDAEARKKANATIDENLETTLKKHRGPREPKAVGKFFESKAGALLKSSSLMTEFDGGKPGVWFKTFIQPLADAGVAQLELLKKPEATFKAAIDKYKKEKTFGTDNSFLSAQNALAREVTFLGQKKKMSEVITIALNMGTASSQSKFEQGYTALKGYEAWSIDNIMQELDRLMDREDWDLVEGIWDSFDQMKTPLQKFTERVLTANFNEEAGVDIPTRHGTIKGKYYPIKYDIELTQKNRRELAEAMNGETTAIDSITHAVDPKNMMEAFSAQTLMSTGVTKSRTKAFAPISLDIDNAPRGLRDTAHLITHYEPAYNVMQRYKVNKDLIIKYAGPTYAKAMENMLFGVARDERRDKNDSQHGFGRLIEDHIAPGLTIASIGLSMTTIAKQPLGLISASADVPPKYLVAALADIGSKGFTQVEAEMSARSGYMKNYEANFNVDIAEELEKLNSSAVRGTERSIRASSFMGIAYVQKRVSTVVWVGAYQQGIELYNDEARAVAYADQAVRETQGSGDLYNQANFQRWSGAASVFRLFSTFTSVLTSAYIKRAQRFRDNKELNARLKVIMDVVTIGALMPLTEAAGGVVYDAVFKSDEDNEDMLDRFAAKAAGGTVGVIPVVGPAITGLVFYGSSRDPLSQVIDLGYDAGTAILSEDDIDKHGVKSIIKTFGILAKMPVKEVERAVDTFWEE